MDFFELVTTYASMVPLILFLCFTWAAIETWLEERKERRDEHESGDHRH